MNSAESTALSRLVAAPFTIENPFERMGKALWLYLWLVLHVNHTGRVCRMLGTLERELLVSRETIEAWLGTLQDTHLVEIQNPAPYLVLKLRFWSSSDANPQEASSALTRAHARVDELLPEQQPKAAPAAGEVGGPGEGEGIVARALEVLGAGADEAEVRRLVARHPVERVRRALERVERTPQAQIRRSRLALFRYLLVKLAIESQ